MTEVKKAKRKEYNRRYREAHPEVSKRNSAYIKAKYRTDEQFQELTKYRQKKTYWKRQGYNYEQYDMPDAWNVFEHLKDYIWEAEEFKITRIKNGWSLEIKTRI